jgi:hypothetical protein
MLYRETFIYIEKMMMKRTKYVFIDTQEEFPFEDMSNLINKYSK